MQLLLKKSDKKVNMYLKKAYVYLRSFTLFFIIQNAFPVWYELRPKKRFS